MHHIATPTPNCLPSRHPPLPFPHTHPYPSPSFQPTSPQAQPLPLPKPHSPARSLTHPELPSLTPTPTPQPLIPQIIDLASLNEGDTHRYCITVTGPVTVTLTWYDWPASPAAGVTLQNDLDLTVSPASARGLKLRGNGWHDNLNTVRARQSLLLY